MAARRIGAQRLKARWPGLKVSLLYRMDLWPLQ